MKRVIALLLVLACGSLFAGKPICYSAHGGYCQYVGNIQRIYINSGNLILVYFDAAMDDGEWNKAGVSGSVNPTAGAINVNDHPEFGKMFYSTALAAQSSKRQVKIQMRGVYNGYLKIDRIWLSQ